jgi:serine/threonine protein kinase
MTARLEGILSPIPGGQRMVPGSSSSEHRMAKTASQRLTVLTAEIMSAATGADTPNAPMKKSDSTMSATMAPSVAVAASSGSNEWEIAEKDIEIIERIGTGSYGEVFRGRLHGTDVAVKLLSADGGVADDALVSLKAEVAILSQLRHPNVVLYLGACTTPPNIFIATEWCERGSLHDLLYDRTVPLSAANRLGLALQTAQGMSYLHASHRKIIHRDLKSQNLLVSRDFTVKVADFGLTIVRKTSPDGSREKKRSQSGGMQKTGSKTLQGRANANFTALQNFLQKKEISLDDEDDADDDVGEYGVHGTPQWMAPEVLEGQRYNGSVDVYSFGIVLCELFSRILPFSDTYKRFDFIDAVLEEGVMPTIPRWCDTFPDVSADDEEEGSAITPENLPWGWVEDFKQFPVASISSTSPLLGMYTNYPAATETESPGVLKMSSGSVSEEGLGSHGPAASAKDAARAPSSSDAKANGLFDPESGTSAPVLPSAPTKSREPLGGLSEWRIAVSETAGVLRGIIEACLYRDPDRRPSFEELVDLLRAVVDRPPSELFQQLEVPRLREALAYGDQTDAAVAANEIVHFASYALFCNMPWLPTGGSRTVLRIHGGAGSSARRTDALTINGVKRPPLSMGARSLIVKYQQLSTHFNPLLPFAPAPSMNMSMMNSISYVDLGTVLEAGQQLMAGLSARLRANDLVLRSQAKLPLYCPDLALAMELGPSVGSTFVVRDQDLGSVGRVAVFIDGYDFKAQTTAEANAESSQSASGQLSGSSTTGASGAGGTSAAAKRAQAKLMARLAASKEEEQKKTRLEIISASAHVLHATSVLLQVLEAGSPAPTAEVDDDMLESATLADLYSKLPPSGSLDRILLENSSRLVYSLVTILAANELSDLEKAFIVRPTGGAFCDWRYQYKCVSPFPLLPDFGSDALATAAFLLRSLWDRLPLLRTPIAHIITNTCLHLSMRFGALHVLVEKLPEPPSKYTSGATDTKGNGESFTVILAEEIVQMRFLGIALERLSAELGEDGWDRLSKQRSAQLQLPKHPLQMAVDQRLRSSALRRIDGIALGTVDLEEFDPTLC